MSAKDVPTELSEELVEHALAEPSSSARGQLEMLAVALRISGLFEQARQLLQTPDVCRRFCGEQLVDRRGIDGGGLLGHVDAGHLVGELVHAVQSAELGERALERQLLATLKV